MVKLINTGQFDKTISNWVGKVIVAHLGDSENRTCQMKVLTQWASQDPSTRHILLLSSSDGQIIRGKYSLNEVPVFLLFENGAVLDSFTGEIGNEELNRWISQRIRHPEPKPVESGPVAHLMMVCSTSKINEKKQCTT
jgi:thioredoxin-like negative regulator of GroEL